MVPNNPFATVTVSYTASVWCELKTYAYHLLSYIDYHTIEQNHLIIHRNFDKKKKKTENAHIERYLHYNIFSYSRTQFPILFEESQRRWVCFNFSLVIQIILYIAQINGNTDDNTHIDDAYILCISPILSTQNYLIVHHACACCIFSPLLPLPHSQQYIFANNSNTDRLKHTLPNAVRKNALWNYAGRCSQTVASSMQIFTPKPPTSMASSLIIIIISFEFVLFHVETTFRKSRETDAVIVWLIWPAARSFDITATTDACHYHYTRNHEMHPKLLLQQRVSAEECCLCDEKKVILSWLMGNWASSRLWWFTKHLWMSEERDARHWEVRSATMPMLVSGYLNSWVQNGPPHRHILHFYNDCIWTATCLFYLPLSLFCLGLSAAWW